MKEVILLLLLLGAGCTNAYMKQYTTYGKPGTIICFSGGVKILETSSTGKISTEERSDGWFFEDYKTKKLIRVSADCIIEN